MKNRIVPYGRARARAVLAPWPACAPCTAPGHAEELHTAAPHRCRADRRRCPRSTRPRSPPNTSYGRLMRVAMQGDRYSIYLRPKMESGGSVDSIMSLVERNQASWAGPHVTLCSFATECSSGLPNSHGSQLTRALQQIANAAAGAAEAVTVANQKESSDPGMQPSPTFVSNPDLVQLPPTPALYAIVGAVSACRLKGARSVRPHRHCCVSLGSAAVVWPTAYWCCAHCAGRRSPLVTWVARRRGGQARRKVHRGLW